MINDYINCANCKVPCSSKNMSSTACPLTESTLFDIEAKEHGHTTWKELWHEEMERITKTMASGSTDK